MPRTSDRNQKSPRRNTITSITVHAKAISSPPPLGQVDDGRFVCSTPGSAKFSVSGGELLAQLGDFYR